MDSGSAFITREDDGTVTVRARSPGSNVESRVNMSWDNWKKLCEIGPMRARRRSVARGEHFETCTRCMGSGISNHPDSNEICDDCKGRGALPALTA
jgi:hypothetical protein